MKKLLTILAAVMLVGLIVPAFSAVENVKVGGDIVAKGILRKYFGFINGGNLKTQRILYTGARVYVGAELSNNLSAMVRFINENDWGRNVPNQPRNEPRDVVLDLAYVKVADLMVPGLNLTVGRQEIQIADGLVVGSSYRVANYPTNLISAPDLGLEKAFDAIKLDYAFTAAPVTVSAFKSKLLVAQDFNNLYGLDIGIKGESLVVNPYYVNVSDPSRNMQVVALNLGWNPMEALGISAEYAKQFGEDKTPSLKKDYEGWALVVGVDYKFATNMKPVISAMYADFSGEKNANKYGWQPVAPSNIASRVGKIAYPALFKNGEGSFDIGTGNGVRVLKLGLGLQPTEKVGVNLDWFHLTAKETAPGISDSVGNEIDLGITYAYSEDLSFGLDLGYFLKGNYIKNSNPGVEVKSPWQAIGTMKVAF